MQKGPQLCHIILDRCTSQQQSVPTIEAKQGLPSYTAKSNIQWINDENIKD